MQLISLSNDSDDAGAPYMTQKSFWQSGKATLVAIHALSWPAKCLGSFPASPAYLKLSKSMAVNVHSHMDWILNQLKGRPLNDVWKPLEPVFKSWGVSTGGKEEKKKTKKKSKRGSRGFYDGDYGYDYDRDSEY